MASVVTARSARAAARADRPARAARPRAARAAATQQAGAGEGAGADRRGVLLAGAASVAAIGGGAGDASAYVTSDIPYQVCGKFPAGYELPPQSISAQSADYAARLYNKWLCGKIGEYMDGADINAAVRLSLMDVGTGAMNGSIRFELDRPYAAGLGDIVKQYEECKKKLDAELEIPIGYGDLYALGGKVIMNRSWRRDFAGLTDKFGPKATYEGLGKGEFPGDIDDPTFYAAFTQFYAPADLSSKGTPVLLGRPDADAACSEEAAKRLPFGSDNPKDYTDWAKGLRVKFLAVVPIAEFLDADGTAVAAIRSDDQLNGFWERNDRDSAFPGLKEKRQVYAYSDFMATGASPRTGKFDTTKYGIPVYVKNLGWSVKPPIKGVDLASLNPILAGQAASLECHAPGPDGL